MGSSDSRHALLILNRKSRSGGSAIGASLEVLRAGGITLAEANCDCARDVSQCILDHAGHVGAVIVGGGDGTLNAAGRGLIASGLPLGVLPLGTANDFARSIGLPLEAEAAARLICDGHTRRIDVGVVNDLPFFNVASVGLAAQVARNLSGDIKRRFGRLSYAIHAGRLMLEAKPFHATLITDAETLMVRTMQITVGNGRYYGGGNVVAAGARIDDGHLNLYSLEFSQVWRLALMLRSFKSGSHGALREVRTARGASFEIITRHPRPVNADGEIVTQTPARFSQLRGVLSVFTRPDLGLLV